jgi:hypothetical protein
LKPLLLFILIIPVLTELLSGNQPPGKFFSPGNYFILLIFYSVPALLIREALVRWRLGVLGLFVLGIAYGIFNEGVIARTLLLTDDEMFISLFRGYSTWGINLAWAAAILPWHALYSIFYPIVIIHTLYPKEAERPWLSTRGMLALGGVAAVLGSLTHFSTDLYRATPVYYLFVFWGSIVFLIGVVKKISCDQEILRGRAPFMSIRKGVGLGCLMEILFLTSLIMGGTRIPAAGHIVVIAGLLFIFFRYFKKREYFALPTLAVIAVGHYALGAVLVAVFSWGDIERLLGEVFVGGLLASLLAAVRLSPGVKVEA